MLSVHKSRHAMAISGEPDNSQMQQSVTLIDWRFVMSPPATVLSLLSAAGAGKGEP